MKQFKLSAKFYIIYSLVFAVPASWIANSLQTYLTELNPANILHRFAELGIVEAPTTISLLLIGFWLIDQYLWRIKYVSLITSIPRDINGRYEGTLVSSYDLTKTYNIALEVVQSLTNVSVNLYTENSASYTIVAAIGKNNQENWCLSYLYQNKTSTVNHDEDMKDHGGVAMLEIFDKGSTLKGNYFNNPRDRGRHGSIDVKRTSMELLGKFK